MKSLLEGAVQENYAVGAFNVANMEMILGAVRAAEETNSPIILQIAQVRLPYSPLDIIGPMMIAAAKKATVPIAVHFDHGKDSSVIMQALKLGFTSVMIDASHLPIEENIEIVHKVKAMADEYGASIEAEVGQIGGSEGGTEDNGMFYSNPLEVKRLYDSTKVDAIALSIGNAHGLYKMEPKLKFDLLTETTRLVEVPLVLHGGTGICDEDFKHSIALGIRKINIATANFLAVEEEARKYCSGEKRDYFKLSSEMEAGMYQNVVKHIRVFGSSGKAGSRATDEKLEMACHNA
jgi:fructose-bisphosphate aldolase class II